MKFRAISPAALLGLGTLWARGALASTCHSSESVQREEILLFPLLLFPLPWPGAIVHMQI